MPGAITPARSVTYPVGMDALDVFRAHEKGRAKKREEHRDSLQRRRGCFIGTLAVIEERCRAEARRYIKILSWITRLASPLKRREAKSILNSSVQSHRILVNTATAIRDIPVASR